MTLVLLLAAVLAPWLAPQDPSAQKLSERLLPPSARHSMGTDELGRDVLSRTLYGARNHLFDAPHLVVFPALPIMAAVLGFNLMGDALRNWLDPRTRGFLSTLDLTR